MPIEFEEIKPIGDFILAQKDIKPIQTVNGAYYHYSQVCVMLGRMKDGFASKNVDDSKSNSPFRNRICDFCSELETDGHAEWCPEYK